MYSLNDHTEYGFRENRDLRVFVPWCISSSQDRDAQIPVGGRKGGRERRGGNIPLHHEHLNGGTTTP